MWSCCASPGTHLLPADWSEHQRGVNHLPGIALLSNKYNLARLLIGNPVAASFYPRTWLLPLSDVESVFAACNGSVLLKPSVGSRGRGIEHYVSASGLAARIAAVPHPLAYIVQSYVDRPLLWDERKFHLRIYVLITALAPTPRLYVHSSGYARRAKAEYRAPLADSTPGAHITNLGAVEEWGAHDGYDTFDSFNALMDSRGFPAARFWQRIDTILIETVSAAVPGILAVPTPRLDMRERHAFELLGADIIVDASGAPWLLELNVSPSMDIAASPILKPIKSRVLRDTFAVLQATTQCDPSEYIAKEFEAMGGYRRLLPAKPFNTTE